MGIVTLKSAAITNRDATPPVLNEARINQGVLYESTGMFSIATSDSLSSTYRLCQVPSNARISQILLSCESSGTVGSIDIGLFKCSRDGGAVVDQDLFASAQVLTSKLSNSDVTHESAEFNFDETEKALWDVVGASSDPKTYYDVVAYLTAVTSSAAKCTLKVRYTL